MTYKKPNFNRRNFLSKTATMLAGAGVAGLYRYEILNSIAKTLIPQAQAADSPSRVIELCFRSGTPFLPLFANADIVQQNGEMYMNSPYQRNQYQEAGNGLYLNDNSAALKPYAESIAFTQGLMQSGGHTSNFRIRRNGGDMAAPAVALAARNPSAAVVHGVKFAYGNRVVNSVGDFTDLIDVTQDTFGSLFKKPYMPVNQTEMEALAKAAGKLSRQQAAILNRAVASSFQLSDSQNKAVNLMNVDYAQLLDTSSMGNALLMDSTGSAYARNMGRDLAKVLKGFEHNLISSAVIAVSTGDWHRFRNTDANVAPVRNFGTEVSQKLAETIKFLKSTPEPTSTTGETLWDTTSIIMTTEFTRGLARFSGNDNRDGRSQGMVLIGKDVQGGAYGGFDTSPAQDAMPHGINPETGAPVAGMRNGEDEAYHTMQALVGNPHDSSKVMTAMLKGQM